MMLRPTMKAGVLASLLLGSALAAAQDAPTDVPPSADGTARPEAAGAPPPSAQDAAQAAAQPGPLDVIPVPAAAPQDEATELEAVQVTAQKRVQSIVEVPINVSALGRDEIQKERVEQVRDVAAYIPNVDIKEQVPGAIPVVTIRGVGLDDFSSTNSPAAGIYVDGVPLTSLALMSFDLYDMERIEVLKGPQGTLYGRNSNAGAINILTAKPTANREGYLRGGYGLYQAKDAEGAYNLPLGDTFSVRFAGKWIDQGEGYWKSRLTADEPYRGTQSNYPPDAPIVRSIGKRNIDLGRVRATWEPTENLSLDFKVDGLRQRSEMGQPEFFGSMCSNGAKPIDQNHCTDLNGYSDKDGDPYKGDWRGTFPYNIDQLGETLLADYDLGWATLSSVSGHIGFKRFFHIDVDGNPADEFDFFQGDKINQYTQELRLAGDAAMGSWLGGLYYARDNAKVDTPGKHDNLLPATQLSSHILADQDTLGYAAFANMDWKLGHFFPSLEKFTVTTGVRVGYETRKYVGGTTWLINGQPCQPDPAGCVPGTSPGAPPTIQDTHQDSSIKDTSVSWKGGLSYAPTRAWLVYANASQGTKSGGYFSGVTTNNRQLQPYKPEQLRAYELGVKRAGLVALNASVFHYDYKDLQTFMREGSAPVQYVGSVPKATVDGADLDATLRLFDGFTVMGGVGALKGRLGDFTGPNGEPVPAGNQTANSPKLTGNGLIRYELPLFSSGLGVTLQGDAHYSAACFKEATNDPIIEQGAYTIVNARASLLDTARVWELGFWGRNLGNKLYVVQGVDVSSLFIGNRNYNAPRTYGADFIWHFGEGGGGS